MANGEMPCWCDVGEKLVLDRLTVDKLTDPNFDVFNHPRIQEIRRAFHMERRFPFPDICSRCASRGWFVDRPREYQYMRDTMEILHIEPSWLCNLDCPMCVPKAQRTSLKDPPYQLELGLWEALIMNLKRNGVKEIRTLHIEGRGDPLMHPCPARLCRTFHEAYPLTRIDLTTNGNFKFDEKLFVSGLNHLRLSIDGARPESYMIYRRQGDFHRAMRFMSDATEARQRLGLDVHIEWKYILFEWNDSDEEILEAYHIANKLGVELSFCLTSTAGKSRRFDMLSLQAKIEELMPLAKNRPEHRFLDEHQIPIT